MGFYPSYYSYLSRNFKVILLSFLIIGCDFKKEEEKTIKGIIYNSHAKVVKLQLLTFESTETIASSNIDSLGRFSLPLSVVKEQGIYGINFGYPYWITVLDTNMESFELIVDEENRNYSSIITTDYFSTNFKKALKEIKDVFLFHDSITEGINDISIMNSSTRALYDSIDNQINKRLLDIINQTKDPYALIYYTKSINSFEYFEVLKGLYHKIFETLTGNSIYTKQLNKRLKRLENAYIQGVGMIKNEELTNEGKQNIYEFDTIQIGKQVWMAENLNIATANSWCLYDNPKNCEIYGRVYNWFDALNACPVGWKLPSDDDWKELEFYLGVDAKELDLESWRGEGVGTKLKSDSELWDSPNTKINNESGFNALPGGPRNKLGMYGSFGHNATFWTASSFREYTAIFRYLGFSKNEIARSDHSKLEGHSVRCLKNK